MNTLELLPTDLVLLILEKLPDGDLARTACTCRRLYDFATPVLYKVVHFRLPSRFSALDNVINKLEIFTEPSFENLRWTRQVIVVGSWYHEYTEMESDAGIENILSPAVRMFSTLVDVCLARMGGLQSFVWDAEIPPTQRLVSRLAHHKSLTELQLRLGIDSTPYPLFYPPLLYRQYSQLNTIKLNQINSEEVLTTVGSLLSSVRQLRHFYVDVDPESNLPFASTFAEFPTEARMPLTTLYAKGFSDFSHVNGSFWNLFYPNVLEDLTIEAGFHMTSETVNEFWKTPLTFQHSLHHLCTNMVDRSLIEFTSTCMQLETLVIKSCTSFDAEIDYQELVNMIGWPIRGLRSVGFYPQGQDDEAFCLSREAIYALSARCPCLREVAFGLESEDFSTVEDILSIPNLRVLHLSPKWLDNDHVSSPVIYPELSLKMSSDTSDEMVLDPPANDNTDSSNAPPPTNPVRPTRNTPRSSRNASRRNASSSTSTSTTPRRHQPSRPTRHSSSSISHSQTSPNQPPPPPDPTRPPPTSVTPTVHRPAIQRLEQYLLHQLSLGKAPHLKIIAFNHGYPFEVKRRGQNGLRLERMQVLVSSVERSELFRYPFLEWAEGR